MFHDYLKSSKKNLNSLPTYFVQSYYTFVKYSI